MSNVRMEKIFLGIAMQALPEGLPDDEAEQVLNSFASLLEGCNEPGYERRIDEWKQRWEPVFEMEGDDSLGSSEPLVADIWERLAKGLAVKTHSLFRGNGCPLANPRCDGRQGYQWDGEGRLMVMEAVDGGQRKMVPIWCGCRKREEELTFDRRRVANLALNYLDEMPALFREELRKLDRNSMRYALGRMRALLRPLGQEAKSTSFVILGPAGIGKTLAMYWILGKLIESTRGLRSPVILHVREFAEDIGAIGRDESSARRVQSLIDASRSGKTLFGIDDLDRGRKSDAVRARLSEIVDFRYSRLYPTIVTSNLTPDELNRYDSDLMRRLLNNRWTLAINLHGEGEILNRRRAETGKPI